MDKHINKPKPDDRSDNAEKLDSMIKDTLENIDEANERMQWAEDHEIDAIKDKNKRRKDAVQEFQHEIQDEIEQ